MTFDNAKALLEENNISFSELHFDSVAEFRLHISPLDNACVLYYTPYTPQSLNGCADYQTRRTGKAKRMQ